MSSTSRRQDPPARAGGLIKGTKKTQTVKTRYFALFTVVLLTTVLGLNTFAVSASSNTETAATSTPRVQASFLGTAFNEFLGYFGAAKAEKATPSDDLVAATPAPFFNGFETDINGWTLNSAGSYTPPTRVASGTGGVTSKTGAFHAVATNSATDWGGYSSTFPVGGYTTSLDIYLNVANCTVNNTVFDWDSAINDTAGNFRRDFVFNGGCYTDATAPGSGPRFVFTTSNNGNPASQDVRTFGTTKFVVNTTGWYTFQHRFVNNGGVLSVQMSILNAVGTVVNTWTLSDPTDIIGTTVGGNRYGWFDINQIAGGLPIDNSQLSLNPAPTGTTCTPAGFGNVTTPGLQSFYRFEGSQAGGGTFYNDSANGLPVGTPIGTPGTAAGQVGQAVLLNGTNNGVDVDNGDNAITGALSLDAAINPSNLGTLGAYRPVVAKYGANPSDSSYFLGVVNNAGVLQAVAGVYQATGANQILFSGGAITPGIYTNIGMSYDPASGTLTLYVNGVAVNTQSAGTNRNLQPGTGSTRIGADNAGRFFAGAIDEVQIYNTVVPASGFQSIYNAGAFGTCASLIQFANPLATTTDVPEGNAPNVINVPITRSGDTTQAGTFTVNTSGGTATPSASTTTCNAAANNAADDDYVPIVNQTVTFAANSTTDFIPVTICGNTFPEADEFFLITLTPVAGSSSGIGANNQNRVNILDDDSSVAVTSSATSVLEGTGGAGNSVTFTFTRSGDAATIADPLTVPYTTNSQTAVPGANCTTMETGTPDYTQTNTTAGTQTGGSVVFGTGVNSVAVVITTCPDGLIEADETINFVITAGTAANPYSVSSTNPSATTTITNDDIDLKLSATVTNSPTREDSGTPLIFTVSRDQGPPASANTAVPVSFTFDSTGTNATCGTDYLVTARRTVANGGAAIALTGTCGTGFTATLAATDTSFEVLATPQVDGVVEGPENVPFTLTDTADYDVVGTATQTGVITDDEVFVAVAATNSPQFEDNTAAGSFITYTFTRQTIGGANAPANQITGALTVNFSVTGPTATATDRTACGPNSTGAAVTCTDGNGVDYTVAAGANTTLNSFIGSNGTTVGTGNITIAANAQSGSITVDPSADVVLEPNEHVTVTVTTATVVGGNPAGQTTYTPAANPNNVADGVISNDDSVITFVNATQTQPEANTPATIQVVRTGYQGTVNNPSASTSNITFTNGGGGGTAATGGGACATPGVDYVDLSGTQLSFINGNGAGNGVTDTQTTSINVPICNDTVSEGNETFTATLVSPSGNGTTLGTQTTDVVTITDDDTAPTFAFVPTTATAVEGSPVVFNIRRTGASNTQSVVCVQTANDPNAPAANATGPFTATAGSDYTAIVANGTNSCFTFAANPQGNSTSTTDQAVSVTTVDDQIVENPETFLLQFASSTNGTTSNTAAVGTITDNDTSFSVGFTANAGSGNEGDSNTGAPPRGSVAVFTVTRNGVANGTQRVDISTINTGTAGSGTATSSTPNTPEQCGQVVGTDYISGITTLEFTQGGPSTMTFSVLVCGDTLYEANETINVRLTNPQQITGTGTPTVAAGGSDATYTIINDDSGPRITVNQPAAVLESAQFVRFVVSSTGSTFATTVDFTTTDGTATSPADYTGTNTSCPAGSTSQGGGVCRISIPGTANGAANSVNIDIPVIDDTVFEGTPNETFTLNVTNAQTTVPNGVVIGNGNGAIGATLRDGSNNIQATLTSTGSIIDNDAPNSFSVADVRQNEGTVNNPPGSPATTPFFFRITRNGLAQGDANGNQTVCYRTVNGNADVPGGPVVGGVQQGGGPNPAIGGPNATGSFDYTAITNNCVTFSSVTGNANNVNFFDIPVTVNADTIFENDETFSVVLTTINTVAAPVGPAAGQTAPFFTDQNGLGTILNDDNRPVFTVTARDDNGNAAGNVDEGTTVPPSVVNRLNFDITRSGSDTEVTSTVTFTVGGGTATAGTSCTDAGTDYIILTSDAATGYNSAVDPAAPNGLLQRTFAGGTQGNVVVQPGTTSRLVSIGVCADSLFETNETVVVNLTNVNDGTFGATSATGTIRDDDNNVVFTVNDVSVTEGNTGDSPVLPFVITKVGNTALFTTVCYNTVDQDAFAGEDYVALPLGPTNCVTFAPGETTKSVPVTVIGDNKDEVNETMTLQLVSATQGTTAAGSLPGTGTSITAGAFNQGNGADFVGVGTIIDDDATALFAVGNVVVNEGTTVPSSPAFAYVRLTRTGQTGLQTTVSYSTASTGSAIGGASCSTNNVDNNVDYITNSGSIVFPAGGFTASNGDPANGTGAQGPNFIDIPVQICRDSLAETTETFNVVINSAGQNGVIATNGSPALVTINDDDSFSFVIRNPGPEAAEGNTGSTTAFTFTIDRVGTTSQASVVCYTTVDGTATVADNDYQPITAQAGNPGSGTNCVSFAANQGSQPVTVFVNGDNKVEGDEDFFLRLVSATNNGTVPTGATGDRRAVIDNDDLGQARLEGDINRDLANPVQNSGTRGTVDVFDLQAFTRYISGAYIASTGQGSEFQALDDDPKASLGDGCVNTPDQQQIANYISGGSATWVPAGGKTAPDCANARPVSADKASKGVEPVLTERDPNVAAVSHELKIGQVTAAQGTTVVVPITLDAVGDETAAQFSVTYNNQRLTFVSATAGNGLPAGSTFSATPNQANGTIGVAFLSNSPIPAGLRTIVNVTFTVAANAPLGTTPVGFSGSPTPQILIGNNGAIQGTYTDGSVNVVTARSIRIVSTTGPLAPGKSTIGVDLVTPFGGERGASFSVNFPVGKFTINGNDPSNGGVNPDVALGAAAIAAGCTVTVNGTQVQTGAIGFSVFCTNDLPVGTDRLLNLTFTNTGAAAGSINDITFSGQPINRGVTDVNGSVPLPSFVNGTITILGPTASGVTISGRVMTAEGQGLRNATVVITDRDGVRRTVVTSSFGFYQIDDVAAGGTYVVGVSSKTYRFASRVIQVSDSLTDVNFTGQE